MVRKHSLVVCIGLLFGLATPRSSALEYRLHVLDPLPGHHRACATGINDQGQVVGFSEQASGSSSRSAIVWTGFEPSNLGMPARYYDVGINDRGDIASDNQLLRDGAIFKPPAIDLYGTNTFHGINGLGQIVGEAMSSSSDIDHAALWDDLGIHDLGTLPGDRTSVALDINDSGQVVGTSDHLFADCTAIVWEGGCTTALPKSDGHIGSYAYAVNSAGTVAGCQFSLGGTPSNSFTESETCIWRDGLLIAIPVAGRSSYATDINDQEQVVGSASRQNRPYYDIEKAFVWNDGELTWLSDLGYGAGACAINNAGWIAGAVIGVDRNSYGAVWEPVVPEPACLVALLGDIIALSVVRRRCPSQRPRTLGLPVPDSGARIEGAAQACRTVADRDSNVFGPMRLRGS